MRVATAPLYDILLKHEGHDVFLKSYNNEIVLYCATCKESVFRQQKPEPVKQGWSV